VQNPTVRSDDTVLAHGCGYGGEDVAVRIRVVAVVASAVLCAAAVALAGQDARSAVSHAWQPFVLLAGLLLVGALAHREGLFDAVGHHLGGFGRRPAAALCSALALVAVTTALLNLDTAAAFLTPVVILAARRRRVSEDPQRLDRARRMWKCS
jgi:arsenical pump membrane protein